mgnify:FL=1
MTQKSKREDLKQHILYIFLLLTSRIFYYVFLFESNIIWDVQQHLTLSFACNFLTNFLFLKKSSSFLQTIPHHQINCFCILLNRMWANLNAYKLLIMLRLKANNLFCAAISGLIASFFCYTSEKSLNLLTKIPKYFAASPTFFFIVVDQFEMFQQNILDKVSILWKIWWFKNWWQMPTLDC